MEERIVRKLMSSVKCSQCVQPYLLGNVKVLGHHQSMWFFNVYCPTCQNYYYIAASVTSDNMPTATDLTPTDRERFQKTKPLTSDDVLDMHTHLKNFHGDVTHLLNTKMFNV
jgi:hypothetical protein